jgi:hypothetical protein
MQQAIMTRNGLEKECAIVDTPKKKKGGVVEERKKERRSDGFSKGQEIKKQKSR